MTRGRPALVVAASLVATGGGVALLVAVPEAPLQVGGGVAVVVGVCGVARGVVGRAVDGD